MAYNILLVDDDKEFKEEFSCFFEEYNIILANNGEEAIKILESPNEIDLVLLDVMMPGVKGTKVLLRIKELYPKLKVIILTGYSSKDIAVEALKGKADDYLEKPINVSKTRLLIESMLINKTNSINIDNSSEIDEKIKKILYFIKRNSQKKIALDEVSKLVFLSPKYLSRIFKEKVGVGFKEYVLNAKIEEAKKILTETIFTISEISYKLGYKNTESFNRLFKKETGLTPTEFKNISRK